MVCISKTSKSVLSLLSKLPDAQGTMAFLRLMQCVVDSYLDKKLGPMVRLDKAWFAVFLVRYWRWWLFQHPHYTLTHNVVTTNTYECIELNAHALILLLMQHDVLTGESFLPWMLGSQMCEKMFRAAQSMSSTFSTTINFAMLGLLRRLHRLHMQVCLELTDRQHRDPISMSRSPQEGWSQ